MVNLAIEAAHFKHSCVVVWRINFIIDMLLFDSTLTNLKTKMEHNYLDSYMHCEKPAHKTDR